MKHAAILYTPVQVAIGERQKMEERERNARVALYKRRSIRARGGYDPNKDGIKLLIKTRMQDVMRRRLRAGSGHAASACHSVPETSQDTEASSGALESPETRAAALVESRERLNRLRALHAAQIATREVSE